MTPTQLLFFSLPYLVAASLGLLLPILALQAYRKFGVGAGMAAAVFCLDAILPSFSEGGLQLGVRVAPMDLVVFILIPITLIRFLLNPELRVRSPGFYLFILVLALNTVHGLVVYKAAGANGARAEVYAVTLAAYASTFQFNPALLRSLLRVLLAVGGVLVLLALYRWVVTAMEIRDLLPPSGSFQPQGHSKWRVVNSSETLVLVELAVLAWFFGGRGQPLAGWQMVTLPLLAMVALLQHRSTWVAGFLAVLAAMAALRASGLAGRRSLGLLSLLAALVVAGALVLGNRGGIGGDVQQSAADAVQLRGTASSRLGSWGQLLKQWAGSGPRALVVGNPTGTVYERYSGDELSARRLAFQAHNYFVTVITSHGVLGFAAYLWLCAQLLWRLTQAARLPQHQASAGVLLTLLVAQLGYYLTYGSDFLQWLPLGVALAFVQGLNLAPAVAGQALSGATTPALPALSARPRVPVRRRGAY